MGNSSGRLCIGSKTQLEAVEPTNNKENHEDQRFAKMMKSLNVTEFTVDKKDKFWIYMILVKKLEKVPWER